MNEADMLISTRRQEAWPGDDYRKADRASKMFKTYNVKMAIACANPVCPEPSIVIVKGNGPLGEFILRCGCTDRKIMRFVGNDPRSKRRR